MRSVVRSTVFLQKSTIYYEYYPAKKRSKGILLLLHGFISSSYSFRRLIPYLTDFDVYTLDLPGFGRSEKSIQFHYSFNSYSDLIITFCQHFQLNKISLIGHSMGGQISLFTARKKPDLVERIILLSSSGYLKRVRKPFIYATYVPFFDHVIKRWLQSKDYKAALLQVVHNKEIIDEKTYEEYTRPLNERAFFKAMIRLMRQREGDLTRDELAQIPHPCMILWGEEDKIIPVKIGKKLAEDLPNTCFYTFEKTGHLLPEERSEEVFSFIDSFLVNKYPV